jgi:SSS family solute:Na+ symporter
MAFPTLVKQLLPPGCTGLVMAGLMGCVMSHIASMLSASSAIVTFDIYKNYFRREATSAELIFCGRGTTIVLLVVATSVGYFLRDLNSIFIFIQKYWSLFYPTVCALFLAGFFYPRANARGSLIVIIAGPLWAGALMMAESFAWIPTIPFLNRAILDFLLAFLLLWAFRTRGEELPPGAVIDRTFSPDVQAYLQGIPWYMSFNFWSCLLMLIIVSLYVRFF